MADYKVSGENLTAIANAIRTKGETSEGLSFPDGFVTAIGNIDTGGGSTLITKSITANGTYNASSDNADGYSQVSVNVPYVTGSFKGTSSGVLTVPISYSGSGYPVAMTIYPEDGTYNSESDIYSAVQKYAFNFFAMAKCLPSVAPDYTSGSGSNIDNQSAGIVQYKNSTTTATDYTSSHTTNSRMYGTGDAQESRYSPVIFNSSTSMSVYIASTSYGFMKDIKYTYQIMYSA